MNILSAVASKYIHTECFIPLKPSAHKRVRIAKISILKLEGIIKKNSNGRRDYEKRLSPEIRRKEEFRH